MTEAPTLALSRVGFLGQKVASSFLLRRLGADVTQGKSPGGEVVFWWRFIYTGQATSPKWLQQGVASGREAKGPVCSEPHFF